MHTNRFKWMVGLAILFGFYVITCFAVLIFDNIDLLVFGITLIAMGIPAALFTVLAWRYKDERAPVRVCARCATINGIHATACRHCQSRELLYQCDNCRTKFASNDCPACGLKAGTKPRECPKCGGEYYGTICPKCGYITMPEKRRTSVGTVLLWIFFLPIMATIAIARSRDLKQSHKVQGVCYIWVAVAMCVYALTGGFN